MLLFLVVVEEVIAGNHEGSEDSDSDSEKKKEGCNIGILGMEKLAWDERLGDGHGNNCNVVLTLESTT